METDSGSGEYMGASTDEVALVSYAKIVGFELVARDNDSIVVRVGGDGEGFLGYSLYFLSIKSRF